MGDTFVKLEDGIRRGKRKKLIEALLLVVLFLVLAGILVYKFLLK